MIEQIKNEYKYIKENIKREIENKIQEKLQEKLEAEKIKRINKCV